MLIIEFLKANLGTIIVALILVAMLVPMVISLVKKKAKGESSCGCGCSSCPMSGKCHGISADSSPEKKASSGE